MGFLLGLVDEARRDSLPRLLVLLHRADGCDGRFEVGHARDGGQENADLEQFIELLAGGRELRKRELEVGDVVEHPRASCEAEVEHLVQQHELG